MQAMHALRGGKQDGAAAILVPIADATTFAAARPRHNRRMRFFKDLLSLSGFQGVAAGALAPAVQQAGRTKASAGKDIAASGNIAPDSSNMAATPGAGKTLR